MVPGLGVTQVGLAVNQWHRADIAGFVEHLDARFGLRDRRVVDKRGGMIPINGLLRRFHDDGVLLIGDAAGMVSPLTAGGIHRSYRFGRLAADAIADYLDGDASRPGDVVSAAYKGGAWKQSARLVLRQPAVGNVHGTWARRRQSIQPPCRKSVLRSVRGRPTFVTSACLHA